MDKNLIVTHYGDKVDGGLIEKCSQKQTQFVRRVDKPGATRSERYRGQGQMAVPFAILEAAARK